MKLKKKYFIKNPKILIANPPWNENGKTGIRAGSRWPYMVEKLSPGDTIPYPFFPCYATSLLKKNGYDALFEDSIAQKDTIEIFFEKLRKIDPDIFFIETSTSSFNSDIQILKKITEINPEIILITGGTHASVFPDEILKNFPFIDFIISGEYEETLLSLISAISKNPEEIKIISGIGFIDYKEDSIILNPNSKPVDINSLPYPARNRQTILQYNEMFCKFSPNVSLLSSRGCPYHCNFCLWPQVFYKNNLYRTRNVKSVADELEYLKSNYNFKEYYFDDDSINISKNHINDLCKEISGRKLNIHWACMGNAGNFDIDTVELMAASGCEAIKLGVESGADEILLTLKNKICREELIRKINYFKKFNIRTHLTFSIGHANETEKTLRETLDFIDRVNPESLQVSFLTPFPGTDLYNNLSDEERKSVSHNGMELKKSFSKIDGKVLVDYFDKILFKANELRKKNG